MRRIFDFNASTVPLEGANLVEASAGTGKTYSIGLLVLRLLLEKEIPVKEILMVTFTNAAVAELEQRIRLFIRLAYKAGMGEPAGDENIDAFVAASIQVKGEMTVRGLLKDAVLFLDETNVLTIHSFCQKTLNEFALETGQVFSIELLQDTSALLEEKVNRFWRQYITTIPAELLSLVLDAGLSRKTITALVREHARGKRYLHYKENTQYSICEEDHLDTLRAFRQVKAKEKKLQSDLIKTIEADKDLLIKNAASNHHAKSLVPLLEESPQLFIDAIFKKREQGKVPDYLAKLFSDVMSRCDECDKVKSEIDNIIGELITHLNCIGIHTILPAMENSMKARSQLTFDDLITNLYKAVVLKDNPDFAKALRKKYRAVFIDEFQDTDRMQYEIFKKIFGRDFIIFYIGDPKQSIYAFRKADIFTYFNAYDDVNRHYAMNENFRSSENLIRAMNHFFAPTEDFDTFYFSGSDHEIKYIPVKSPPENTKGVLQKDQEEVTPISVSIYASKKEISAGVAAQVRDLLENNYQICKDKSGEKVVPPDIGILVKTNKEGAAIKQALAGYGIPAVTISDDKIFECAEARYLLYLLMAMVETNKNNINKALLSPFTGFSTADIIAIDHEKALSLFSAYKVRWENEGIYPAIMDFVNDFGIKNILLDDGRGNGQRVIANLFQLTELLHKTQASKKFSPPELVNWFSRSLQGMKNEGDEYIQRMESDDMAVKIVTIHKSKGLEYKIVIVPFPDFTIDRKNHDHIQFRDPFTREYVTIEKGKISANDRLLADRQQEQEHRRLLYVAVTRAVYKVYIFKNSHYKASTITTFVNALPSEVPGLITRDHAPTIPAGYRYKTVEPGVARAKRSPVNFVLQHKNWKRLSYTFLSGNNEHIVKERTLTALEAYDRFVFHELTSGAKTGLMLHDIMERIHFGDSQKWEAVLTAVVNRYAPSQPGWVVLLQAMLSQVLEKTIAAGGVTFSLKEVLFDRRIHEFEFDFPVPVFDPQRLNNFATGGMQINVEYREQLEGMMNGKIDLFFECREKYFVLDWKSNFLGASLEAYLPAGLNTAMNENNYHLQYLIYTVAAKKYLESRLPHFNYEKDFGGVIYIFLRAVRKGSDTGIFICRPSLDMINRLERLIGSKVSKV